MTTRLDPIFQELPPPDGYSESLTFLKVRIAGLEEDIEANATSADRKLQELPILEREIAEHQRDAAVGKLKLLELQAELERREAGSR
jgi:hypothetical protein